MSREVQRAVDCFVWKHTKFCLSGKLDESLANSVAETIRGRGRITEFLCLIMDNWTLDENRECAEYRLASAIAIVETLPFLSNLRSLKIKAPNIPSRDAARLLGEYEKISVVSGSRLRTLELILPWRVGDNSNSILTYHPLLSHLTLDFGMGAHKLNPLYSAKYSDDTNPSPYLPHLPHLETIHCQDWETLRVANTLPNPSPLREIHITRANFQLSRDKTRSLLSTFIPLLHTFSLLTSLNIELDQRFSNSRFHTVLACLITRAVPELPLLHSLQVDLTRMGGYRRTRYILIDGEVQRLVTALSELSKKQPSSALSYLGIRRVAYLNIDTASVASRMFSALESLQCIHLDDVIQQGWNSEKEAVTREYKRREGGGVVEAAEEWIDEDE